jgi:transcriptional regulator with XRE-family HTH domain
MMTLSNKLCIYRAEAKLTQQEVADAIHISKSKYYRMENGVTTPNVDELNALLSLFNISYEEMVNTTFPITHTIIYPTELLSMLEKTIKENSEISENWNENRLRYNRLKEALEPLINIRSEAMDFPELDLTHIIPGTTVKTVNLDMRGEYLIDQCLNAQERLANALFG